jgi:WD40 repeat protein
MFALLLFLATPCHVRCEEPPEPIVLGLHFGSVNAVAFSPDGKALLTGDGKFGTGDGTVRFWDVATWTEKQAERYRHRNKITSLAYSADGTRLASASLAEFLRPPELYIMDLMNRRMQGLPENDIFATWCLAISPDGKTLASAHDSGQVKLWNLPDVTLRSVLKGHSSRVLSIAFSPDGATLASAELLGMVKLWDVAGKTEIASMKDEDFYVYCVAFAADGLRLATGGGGYDQKAKKWTTGGVRIWDTETQKVALRFDGNVGSVRAVAFGRGRSWLATASGFGVGLNNARPGELRFWNPSDGTKRLQFALPAGLNSLALSPDGKYLAAGCDDDSARIWDVSGIDENK